MGQDETLVGVQGELEPVSPQSTANPPSAADETVRIVKTGQTRLSGTWLTLARVAWIILLVANLAAAVIGIPLINAQKIND